MEWVKEFIRMYFSGDIEKAYRYKHINIPKGLYKYQPFEEQRISTLIDKKLWFTIPKEMNDPFDSRGMYWDSEEIERFLREKISDNKIREFSSIDDIVNGGISSLRDNIKITCFSEELFSMPMWSHYANNHTGFCIEYNFANLDCNQNLTRNLFPVAYESQRYDITNLFKKTFNETYDNRIKLLFFLMNIKHKSWLYEKEWRIIRTRLPEEINFTSGLEECPLKPTAIYLGVNFDKEKIPKIKDRLSKVNVPIYKLKTNNSQFFDMRLEEV